LFHAGSAVIAGTASIGCAPYGTVQVVGSSIKTLDNSLCSTLIDDAGQAVSSPLDQVGLALNTKQLRRIPEIVEIVGGLRKQVRFSPLCLLCRRNSRVANFKRGKTGTLRIPYKPLK
jgi:hypothetical protein